MPMHPHPGAYIQAFIRRRRVTQQKVAEELGVSRLTVNELCNGKRTLTPHLALRMQDVYGVSARELLLMQVDFDLERAIEEASKAKPPPVPLGKDPFARVP